MSLGDPTLPPGQLKGSAPGQGQIWNNVSSDPPPPLCSLIPTYPLDALSGSLASSLRLNGRVFFSVVTVAWIVSNLPTQLKITSLKHVFRSNGPDPIDISVGSDQGRWFIFVLMDSESVLASHWVAPG